MSEVVRRATAQDAVELVRLRHGMFRAMASAGAAGRPGDVHDTTWHPAARQALKERMAAGVLAAFVVDGSPADADDGDTRGGPVQALVACAVANVEERLPGPGFPSGRAGSMSSVFVEPSRRGRGLGRLVVTAALCWLDEQGAEVVDLHATPDAQALYRSLGFSEPRSLSMRRLPAGRRTT